MISTDTNTNSLLFFLRKDLDRIEEYISDILKREYRIFSSKDEIDNFFNTFYAELCKKLTDTEFNDIRYYTGFSFKDINAIYRNNWSYDVNGHISRKKDFERISEDIEKVFCKTPKIPGNIVAYRGVDLLPFMSYGINSVEELINMKGQYMYESGLTSTSLLKETSFYDRKLDNQKYCNILIEYYIPEECSEAIPLLSSDLSYSDSQNELLLCPSTLTKVLDVETLGDKAILKVAYIPVDIWEPERKANIEDISRL